MNGRSALKRCFVSLILLLVGTALAVAQPFTRRSSQMQHDGLKKRPMRSRTSGLAASTTWPIPPNGRMAARAA
ncbi:hypothetical protein ACVWXN_003174 [Bradyrhizobium sp. i1.4.4]